YGGAVEHRVMAYVSGTGMADRARGLAGEGIAGRAVAGGLTTPDAARRAVAGARERFWGLDVVVNVAGGLVSYGPLLVLKPDRLELELAINIKTAFYVSPAAIRALRDRGCWARGDFASA